MPLNAESKKKSLDYLMTRFCPLSLEVAQRLASLNDYAAVNDMMLSGQSPEILSLLGEQLPNLTTKVESICTRMQDIWNREQKALQVRVAHNGRYDHIDIHQRASHDQLQDHDMLKFMPKPHGNVEVLAPVNTSEASTDAVCEGIQAALANPSMNHIVIPIGPGHWRGIYLTKPDVADAPYQLELFDPMGPQGAIEIEELAARLLERCGVENVIITHTGPPVRQQDGYACGDFTCAYSHLKMQEFGAAPEGYNQHLITTLRESGNKADSLRKAVCSVSRGWGYQQAVLRATSEVNVDPAVTAEIVEYEEKLGERKEIYHDIISAIINVTANHILMVLKLVVDCNSIFEQAEAIIEPKDDTEWALKLQAEELTKAGIRPRF